MGKPVAVEGDVKAIPGTVFFAPADSGAWTAGPITETPYPKLTAGKKKIIYQATCTFSFSGANSAASGAPVVGTEVVTLSAKPTRLQGTKTQTLVNGDSIKDVYGNQLQVVASQIKLSTG